MKKKVLLIRLDKIGDLICTMCVDQVSFLKEHDVHWVISEGLSFVPENADPQRKFLELSKKNWKQSLKDLRRFLKDFKPDIAVSFQAPWWVSYALWAEKVPLRAGVKSQWHSFIFLNKGLRQKRSLAIKHEADYNLDLLRHAFEIGKNAFHESTPTLKLVARENPALLKQLNIAQKKYIVVHPGMAGSALNWPIAHYISLIAQASQNLLVVLTGTPADEPWLKEIKEKFKGDPQVLNLQNLLNPEELFTVLKNSQAVIVPSTGVAHIAASLGANVCGIYSPLTVQHPRRWAARGENVHIFLPAIANPENIHLQCMETITPEAVLNQIKLSIENKSGAH